MEIEERGGVHVVVYEDGSCHPANDDEIAMWKEITILRLAVKTMLATMDNIEVCGMAPALCAFKKAKINLENILEGK